MKLALFGGTGTTGACAVEHALAKGAEVRMLVREPARVPSSFRERVELVVGDALDSTAVERCVRGVDAVVVALGTRNDLSPTTDLSTSTNNIVRAMEANGVDRVSVCLSAFLFYEPAKVPAAFHELTADHRRMFDELKATRLDYIAVLPPHISDTACEHYITEFDKSPGRVISKWNLGKFLVDCLSEPKYYGKVVGITNDNRS